MNQRQRGVIRVLAGTNGAGKSSIGGSQLRALGATYFNPDEVARELRATGAVRTVEEANSQAWQRGTDELERAVEENADFTFETTLGATTIPELLAEAVRRDLEVHIWYVALESVELHIQRVRERVAAGGHDIPEHKIRQRYDSSRENLIRLLPGLASLLYDNSAPPDPETGIVEPKLLLRMEKRGISHLAPDWEIPQWARDIVSAALLLHRP